MGDYECESNNENEVEYRDENVNDLSQNSSENEEVFIDAQAENRSADVIAQNKIRCVSTRERRKPELYGNPNTNCIHVNYSKRDCTYYVQECNILEGL